MMINIFKTTFSILLCSLFTACSGQINKNNQKDNSGTSFYGITKQASAIDTSAAWNDSGQRILLTGTVYKPGGRTPAPDVLIYYYQTNTGGKYLHKPEEKRSMAPNALGQTHGYIRGWVKTGADGKYSIYTIRPGTYPTNDEPAHVHITIKEPGNLPEYYIDDLVFDDDKLLTSAKRKKMENRGGSGVLRLVNKDEWQVGERNIYLGLNIPGYAAKTTTAINSGKNIGEDVFSFIPFHAWGPDKGTRTCPVCKYGWYHGILYFVGNNPNWTEIKQWLVFLEGEGKKREKYLKVYFIYGNEQAYSKTGRTQELERLGNELKLEKLALTFVPSFADAESEIDALKINQTSENTFIIYKRSIIIDKFINLQPNIKNFNLVTERLNHSINEYFDLPKPKR